MIDRKIMRSLLESLERAAHETLQQDSTFYEAVQALKWEIDHDPRVQLSVKGLRASGRSVFSSFVPHVKVRVRTTEGIFGLPGPLVVGGCSAELADGLTEDLRNAASAVIKKSRHCCELDAIVNEAVGASDRFEDIASKIEQAGHKVLICLDLLAYAQVHGSTTQAIPADRLVDDVTPSRPVEEPFSGQFSGGDLRFLKALKISIEEI
jgi:hypothetical protein